MNAGDLRRLGPADLMQLMRAGHPIDPSALDDTDYRGVSLGLPDIALRLTWTTFVKAFHRDRETGELRGWNVRIDQRDPFAYRPKRRRGEPVTFGHFLVVPAEGYQMPEPLHHGLMLDYARGRRSRLAPTSALRDPIVALEPGNPDLLLGCSFVEIAGRQLKTPSFFSLQRT